MRLLVVSTWLPYPPDNGSRVRAYNLVRQLARQHRLTLFAFGTPGSPDDVAHLRAFCEQVEVVPRTPVDRSRLYMRGLLSPVPRYFAQADNASMRALVGAHVLRQDAALAMEIDAAPYLSGWEAVPRVFEDVEVGVYRDAPSLAPTALGRWRRRLTWWKFQRYVRSLVNEFDCSTVVSGTERDHLLEIGCDARRISVVPNGTEVPDVPPARQCRGAQLIYPGPVTYAANLDAVRYFVREILPRIRHVRQDASLLVTGSTEGATIDEFVAQAHVSFTGRLPEIETALAQSAVCVVPLRIGAGTRLKVLQAMALGVPVVSTSKGIEGLAVEAERHLLIADDPSAFAGQVLRLLADPDLARSLSTAGHAVIRERFGWDAIGKALHEVVCEAVVLHASQERPARAGPA